MADSKKIDDGGPAFSGGLFEPQHGGSNDREPWNPGMTLRDWFAGQALAGLNGWVPGHQFGLSDLEGIKARSEWAYAHADAMISARKAGG